MEIKDIINNVKIYDLEESFRASKYPMATDISKVDESYTKTIEKLGQSEIGHGHDNFLSGILVSFDLTFTNKAWVEMERYHFAQIVSSQSTMHKITKFDLDKSYVEYVDPKIVRIMKEKIKNYNDLLEIKNIDKETLSRKYLEILYSNPAGFKLTARVTTNYRQLKTIYQQRKNHRLPEWRVFCEWIETLPYSELITKSGD